MVIRSVQPQADLLAFAVSVPALWRASVSGDASPETAVMRFLLAVGPPREPSPRRRIDDGDPGS